MPDKETPRLPRWFQYYMYVVAVGGNLIFYIQAYEIFTARSAGAVSLAAFSVALWAVTSWFVYGLFLRNPTLIIANLVAIVGATLVIAGRLLYG